MFSVHFPQRGDMILDGMECRILAEALRRNSDKLSQTARVLGANRDKLRYRVQKSVLKTSD